MKRNLLKRVVVLSAITVLLALAGCDTAPEALGTPANVKITVEGRTMTVTWNAVSDAQGYEIITTSTGCGSGNKIINTKNKTANVFKDGTIGADALKNDKSSGAVEINGATSIQITLMAKMGTGNENVPMASAVSAKVRALGDGDKHLDSEYSAVVSKTPGGM